LQKYNSTTEYPKLNEYYAEIIPRRLTDPGFKRISKPSRGIRAINLYFIDDVEIARPLGRIINKDPNSVKNSDP
jgi:hypothetical protein